MTELQTLVMNLIVNLSRSRPRHAVTCFLPADHKPLAQIGAGAQVEQHAVLGADHACANDRAAVR
jgi:hypothetical protein